MLDKKYAEAIKQVDEKLAKQPIGVQIGTDGWKRKNVNENQKIQNFIANFPDGGTQFLNAHDTEVNIVIEACTLKVCVTPPLHHSEASCCDRVPRWTILSMSGYLHSRP